jgi:DNA-binding transcriptional LysR family regulator
LISLRQIKYFITVCQVMKINEAASQLNVSASAVSSALKDLQERVGVPLLERHRRGVYPTPAGKRFLLHCNSIMASLSIAMEDIPKNNLSISGNLRLGVTITIAGYFLSAPLSRFTRANRGIEVEVFEFERDVLEQKIISGELDIALMLVSNLGDMERIEHEILIRSRRRLWTQAGHRLSIKSNVTLQDISREPYIQLLVDDAKKTTQTFWDDHNQKPDIRFATKSVEAIRSMVATGRGVTILSDMLFRRWSLDAERIESVKISDKIPTMDIGLVWSAERRLSDPAKVFQEYCQSEVALRKP